MRSELFLGDFSLWSCLWQSTVFVVIGLASSFILRNRSSRAHQVLFLSMIAAVIVPVVSILVKHYELGVFVAEPAAIQSQPEEWTAASGHALSGTISSEGIGHKLDPIEKDLPPVAAGSESAGFPWRSVVLCGWIAASLALAIRLLVTFVLGVRLLGRALPLECERIEEALHLARAKLGIDRDVKVYSSRGIHSPVIWCWRRRPALLMPNTAERIDNGVDWAGVLCHELAHWKRRDHISGLLAELVVCILPWQALLWWAKSRLVSLSEQACDDWVVATGQPCTDYAETLLDLTPGGQMAFVPAVVSNKRGLAGRVRRILKDSCGNPRTGAVWALAVSITAVCISLGVAVAQTRPAKLETAPDSQDKPAKTLHQAAADGDIEQVRLLISKGADVNAKTEKGWTPLHSAAWHGRKDVADVLLAKGASVNATDISGRTPLHLYATFGDNNYVPELLIAKGANVNARDNRGNTPMHYATDKDLLELLIDKGAEVNARNNNGQTPLHLAAPFTKSKYPKNVAVIFILANGGDVNAKDKNGCTPLCVAAGNGRRDIVELLLGKGAIINEKTDDALTALHRAAMRGRKDVVELLLNRIGRYRKGIYATDSRGWTALHYAARGGYDDIIELLIDYDADLDPRNTRGETPVHLAVVQNHKGTVNLLISKGADVSTIHLAAYVGDLAKVRSFIEKGVSVNAQDGYGLRPLHAAVGAGQRKVAEFLISKGALVNVGVVQEGLGTPLRYAIDGGSKEMTELLISKGATIDAKNKSGETSLHLAAKRGYNDLAELLIANKADVNAKTENGWTSLHFAANNGYEDIAALLIENGADINVVTQRTERTPLLCAARSGHKDVMKLLIDNGADVSPADNLLYWMCTHGHRDLAEFFIQKGANVNSQAWGSAPSLYAVWNNHPDVLELLLDHGANPDAKDRWDWSLLHYTIDSRGRSLEMTRMLLDTGANPNAKLTADSSTPFYWAVGYGLKETVKLFITKGADVNVEGPDGRTPLHVSAQEGWADVAKVLIAQGADLNAKNKWGRTPLVVAESTGHEEIVELLRRHGAKE